MSETWMLPDQVARLIDDAGSVTRIEFYVFVRETGGKIDISCRQPLMQYMGKGQAEELVKQLNAAITPVLKLHSENMLSKAANQLRRFL